MIRPFRAAPAHKPWRPGLLRRSMARNANGDRPPLVSFGSVPFLNKVRGNQRQSAVSFHQTRRRNVVMSGYSKRHSADRNAGGKAKNDNSAGFAKDTALRACIVACSALFVACAGLAVTL